jgi:septum formation protein
VRSRLVETKVRFKRLSRDDMETYLMSDEWRGKAGAYAMQGRADVFVRMINGSYSNVVGLPLYETVSMLNGAGYPVYFSWLKAGGQ